MAQAYLSDFDADRNAEPTPESETGRTLEEPHPQTTQALVADTDTDADPTLCQNCGAATTAGYRRVFGDNQNVLHSCSECETLEALFTGAGARP